MSDLPAGPETVDAPAAAEAGAQAVEVTVQHGSAVKAPTVGVFDSGIGGFTVASSILKLRPELNLLYYADSLNLPYGGRDHAQLERFAGNIIDFLRAHGATFLADGCNSINRDVPASSRMIEHGMPVYDLVDSTCDWLKDKRKPEAIALLATEATVRAGYWEKRLGDVFLDVSVHPIAVPELVPLIESRAPSETEIRYVVGKYVRAVQETGADTVVYGCTHYPLLHSYFVEADIYKTYVDPGKCLAEKVAASVAKQENGTEGAGPSARPVLDEATPGGAQGRPPSSQLGTMRFYNSKPSERFYEVGERVFGREIRSLTKVYIVNPYED